MSLNEANLAFIISISQVERFVISLKHEIHNLMKCLTFEKSNWRSTWKNRDGWSPEPVTHRESTQLCFNEIIYLGRSQVNSYLIEVLIKNS